MSVIVEADCQFKSIYHGYLSFKEQDITPELAQKIGMEFAQKVWGERFQVVVTTHLNTKHLHCHFVINSVSFADGKRLHGEEKAWFKFHHIADELCRKYQLHVIEEPERNPDASYLTMKDRAGTQSRMDRYKIEDHKLVIDPATAHIVQEAFQLYANGESIADICRIFNTKGYLTAKGVPFNRSSFKAIFRNERYIGVYKYKDFRVEDGIPAIIDKPLFETVRSRLSENAQAPARGKAKVDYLLAGKLFCGHCGASMNGESGTSRTGAVYNYYACYTRKRQRKCDKKPLKKDLIEWAVAQDAMELLTDEVIEELADMAIAQSDRDLKENTRIPELTARRDEVEGAISNITKAIEKGVASDTLLDRLTALEKEKKTLSREIKEEGKYVYRIDRHQVIFWLEKFKNGNIEDEQFRRQLIDLLVNSVTVWDEPDGFRVTTAYNLTSCASKTFRISGDTASGSDMRGHTPPPMKQTVYTACFIVSFRVKDIGAMLRSPLFLMPCSVR